ncbi:MAG: hypothetical protein K9G33_06445 [Sneathiella sp.]|nr:hypothetical protein [Sneathiella sp.]
MLRALTTGAVFAAMALSAPATIAGTKESSAMQQEVTMDKIQVKISKAFDAIANYSVEQRDEAIKKISATLEEVDYEIELLEARARDQWGDMSEEAREKTSLALQNVRKQRNVLGEKFGALQEGADSAWDNLKDGIADAWQSLKTAWQDAMGAENS